MTKKYLSPDTNSPVVSTGYISVAWHYGFGFEEMFTFHRVEDPFLPWHGAHTQHSSLPDPVRSTGGCALLPTTDPPPEDDRTTEGWQGVLCWNFEDPGSSRLFPKHFSDPNLAGQSIVLHFRCLSSGRLSASQRDSSTTPTSISKQREGCSWSPGWVQSAHSVTTLSLEYSVLLVNWNTNLIHRWCCSRSMPHVSTCEQAGWPHCLSLWSS